MKPKLSVREREKQRQLMMRGVAAADERLRMADAACVIMEDKVADAERKVRALKRALFIAIAGWLVAVACLLGAMVTR